NVLGNPVIEDALALNYLVFLGIEGSRIVLEMLNQRSRLRAFIEGFRLAFVNAATAAHGRVPRFLKIHGIAVAPVKEIYQIRGGRQTELSRQNVQQAVNLADQVGQHNHVSTPFSTSHFSQFESA